MSVLIKDEAANPATKYCYDALVQLKVINQAVWDAGKRVVGSVEGSGKFFEMLASIFELVIISQGENAPVGLSNIKAGIEAYKDVTGSFKWIKEGDDFFKKPFEEVVSTLRRTALYGVAILSVDKYLSKVGCYNLGLTAMTTIGEVALKDVLFVIVSVCGITEGAVGIWELRNHEAKFEETARYAKFAKKIKATATTTEVESEVVEKSEAKEQENADNAKLVQALKDKISAHRKELQKRVDDRKNKPDDETDEIAVFEKEILEHSLDSNYMELRRLAQLHKLANQRVAIESNVPWISTPDEEAARAAKLKQTANSMFAVRKMKSEEYIAYKADNLDTSRQNSHQRLVKSAINITFSGLRLIATITGISKTVFTVEAIMKVFHVAFKSTIDTAIASLGLVSGVTGLVKFLYDDYHKELAKKQSPSAWLKVARAA